MIEDTTPLSDGWWLKKLEAALILRREGTHWVRTAAHMDARPPLLVLDAYKRGEPPLPSSSQNWAPVMREYLRTGRMNLADLCISSVANKMRPVGFRTEAEDDIDGDSQAAAIARANQLDLRCADVFSWFLTFGDAYMMVTPNPENPQLPYITQEHPFQCITSDDPITGRPRVALKMYRDDDLEQDRAYLFLPGRVRVAVRNTGPSSFGAMATDWNWDENLSFDLPEGMEDVIPLRRFRNVDGTGEFEAHLDTLNRINEALFDRIALMKYQAFALRIFAGLPLVDEAGNKIDYSQIISQDPGALTVLGMPTDEDGTVHNIQFFESRAINFDPFRTAIEADMKAFAAATSTPLHLITPDAAQGSAEGASLQREGGTWKAEDRRRRAEHPLAEVMSLAFRFAGLEDRSDVNTITVIWAPAERFSLAESAAAAQQLRSAGIPLETIAEEVLQFSPEQIARMNAQLADEALRAPVTPAEVAGFNQVSSAQEPVNDRSTNSAGADAADRTAA